MGNLGSQEYAEKAKSRRYSRASGFAHWMDNMKDKKLLKINMKQTSDTQGTFTLTYVDESIDDFFNIKSVFTYCGTYQHVQGDDVRDVFGVVLPVNGKGAIEVTDQGGEGRPDASPGGDKASAKAKTDASTTVTSRKYSKDESYKRSSKTRVKLTKFFTEKLTCKLTEGTCTQNWTIVSSTVPDCLETSAAEIQSSVSWPWNGTHGIKVSHQAPPGTLDFIGEENFEPNGTSSIDLKIRFPQLAAGHFPAAVMLNEMSGWKLGKKSFGGS